jgi:hypothetical protein
METEPKKAAEESGESRRGEHNELGYYNADEGATFDERGSQGEGRGEDEDRRPTRDRE